MKTLIDIVTPLVLALAQDGEQFTAHDVTKETRKAVNLLCERENLDLPAASWCVDHTYEVNHDDVRAIVQNMYREGKVDRVFNGTYFTYYASAPAKPTPVKHSNIEDVVIQDPEHDLADRIYKYIIRRGARPLSHIQGNVCRHDPDNRSNDIIIQTVKLDDRLDLIDTCGAPTSWLVTLS